MPGEDRIRQALRRRADASSMPDGLWERIEGRARPTGVGLARRVGVALLALTVAAASFVFLIQAFRSDPPVQPVDEVGYAVQEFPVDAAVGRLLVAEGSVWIAGDGQVTRVDSSTGEIQAEIPVHLEEGGQYGSVGEVKPNSGLAFGDGLIWVTAEPFFAAIDPATNEISTSIAWESGVTNIAWDDGRLLYGGSAEGNGKALLLDPYLGEFDNVFVGTAAYPLVLATEHWFWAGTRPVYSEYAAMSRASRDGTVIQVVDGISDVDSMVEAGGSLWVTGDRRLWQVDIGDAGPPPSTQSIGIDRADAVIAERSLDGRGIVSAGGGHLWLFVGSDPSGPSSAPGQLLELDPTTGDIVGEPIDLEHSTAASLAVGPDGAPWVTFKGAEVLVTLRERTTSPTPDIPAGTLVFASLADPETGDQLIYRLELPGGDPSLLAGLDSVFEFELSRDGTRLAYTRSLGTYAGDLWVLDLSSGESQRIVQDVGTIFTPRWHRDGKHIAFSAQTYLDDPSIPIFSIYSVRDDGEDLRVLAKPREGAIGIDWSPDGNRIAYLAGAEADIRVLDLPSGETVTVWSHRDGVASRPSWSPDGSLIAIEVRGGIYSVSSEPPFVSQRLTLSTTEVFDQSWSPTGDALFFTGRTAPGDDLDILFIDLETGEITVAAATEMEDSRPSFASN